MSAPSTQTQRISMEDWLDQFGDEPFEFIDGEKIVMSPSMAGSSHTAKILFKALDKVVTELEIGEVMTETAFAFTDDPQWVRRSLVPDVSFVRAEKLNAHRTKYPNWKQMPFLVVPDLVVEVVSPNDRYTQLRRKVSRYLEEGVSLIWVVDYVDEVVEVTTPQGRYELYKNDTLTAGDIIPGFGLKLETLFA